MAGKFDDDLLDTEFMDLKDETDITKLYKQGWSILEIAQSKDSKVSEVLRLIKRNIKNIRPHDLQEAEKYMEFEKDLAFYTLRRIK